MNPNEMMKMAKKMQAELEKKEDEIRAKSFTVEKQGITITFNGSRQMTSIKIDDALVDPDDTEILETMIIICSNEALEQIDQAYDEINNNGSKLNF
ncbi:hypothetical protein EI74_0422 [Mycoplasma testudineum]|uniref:Nucleoid-associated protein EI74_0422 n=1 Tax=Mycoplasma testudineum TaxID=244584 RepID=A0A4R6IH51_9MOLU|nr:YbaB/EbfC family nucleoid-associated protein [Mycoplasma testudineum]OYD26811.1 nucleoid-associated protein, YbaB/EbfC family [Mycoplasma testudineum]TDO20345.1 hypothetical protein EI74_0422 [Mycoplasma testudineum]